MADIEYISDFLNTPGVEGKRQTRGYIPAYPGNFTGAQGQNPTRYKAIGASGVTIATGCDLGQTDVPTLHAYGLSDAIVNSLIPYIGLKTSRAIVKLAQLPLSISPDAAAEIDHCVHRGYLDRYVRPAYGKASDTNFDDLPKQAQAVIFSCCFQKGCGGVRRDWPKLWGYLTRQDWSKATHELKYGFTQYKARRRIEGELLAEIAQCSA